jgi:hypothetical protein
VLEDSRADGVAVPSGVAARLVVGLDAGKAEAIPGRNRHAVGLGEPQTQPALRQRDGCKLAVKRLPDAAECARLLTPAGPVQGQQRVEVGVEAGRVVR